MVAFNKTLLLAFHPILKLLSTCRYKSVYDEACGLRSALFFMVLCKKIYRKWFFLAFLFFFLFFIHLQSNATRSLQQRSGTTEDSSTSYILFLCGFCSFLRDFPSNLDSGCFHIDAVCFELLDFYGLIRTKMTRVKPGQISTAKLWSQPKEAVLVQIKLDHGSVRVRCQSSVLKDSDLPTDDERFSQASHEKENQCRLTATETKLTGKHAKAARKWQNRNRQTSWRQTAACQRTSQCKIGVCRVKPKPGETKTDQRL